MRFDNESVVLARRPAGEPVAADFAVEAGKTQPLAQGEIAVEIHLVSLDPAMRGWMDDRPSYLPPVALGAVMRASAIGRVVASRSDDIAVGDWVAGLLGVQRIAVIAAAEVSRVDMALAPPHVHAGLLATPGLTAYFGVLDIGRPMAGETIVISAAAGAVGSVAGQIARLQGCRVVGIAGGPEKCRYITEECGFDAAIDYKSEDLKSALASACPDGIDIYFDNTGNPMLDAALGRINQGARIALCGAISQYNKKGPVEGPRNYIALIVKRATMRGFIVFDYRARYPEAIRLLADWWRKGDIRYQVDRARGLENFQPALLRLFRGENRGKALLELADGHA